MSTNWLGLIPTGSSFAASASIVANGTPVISPTGPYFYIDNSLTPGSAAYNLQQTQQTVFTSIGPIVTKFHTEISHWYGGHTYSAIPETNGTENSLQRTYQCGAQHQVNFTSTPRPAG